MPQTVPEMHTALLVLALVSEDPMERRQIAGRLEARSSGELRFDESALRRALRHLESEGLLRGRYVLPERGPAVKVYSVTAGGEQQLTDDYGEWLRFRSAVASVLPARFDAAGDAGTDPENSDDT